MTEGLDYVLHKLDDIQTMIAKLSANADGNVSWASREISNLSRRIDQIYDAWIKPMSDKLDKHLDYHPAPFQNSIEVLQENEVNIYRQIDLLKERMDTLELKKKK